MSRDVNKQTTVTVDDCRQCCEQFYKRRDELIDKWHDLDTVHARFAKLVADVEAIRAVTVGKFDEQERVLPEYEAFLKALCSCRRTTMDSIGGDIHKLEALDRRAGGISALIVGRIEPDIYDKSDGFDTCRPYRSYEDETSSGTNDIGDRTTYYATLFGRLIGRCVIVNDALWKDYCSLHSATVNLEKRVSRFASCDLASTSQSEHMLAGVAYDMIDVRTAFDRLAATVKRMVRCMDGMKWWRDQTRTPDAVVAAAIQKIGTVDVFVKEEPKIADVVVASSNVGTVNSMTAAAPLDGLFNCSSSSKAPNVAVSGGGGGGFTISATTTTNGKPVSRVTGFSFGHAPSSSPPPPPIAIDRVLTTTNVNDQPTPRDIVTPVDRDDRKCLSRDDVKSIVDRLVRDADEIFSVFDEFDKAMVQFGPTLSSVVSDARLNDPVQATTVRMFISEAKLLRTASDALQNVANKRRDQTKSRAFWSRLDELLTLVGDDVGNVPNSVATVMSVV